FEGGGRDDQRSENGAISGFVDSDDQYIGPVTFHGSHPLATSIRCRSEDHAAPSRSRFGKSNGRGSDIPSQKDGAARVAGQWNKGAIGKNRLRSVLALLADGANRVAAVD